MTKCGPEAKTPIIFISLIEEGYEDFLKRKDAKQKNLQRCRRNTE